MVDVVVDQAGDVAGDVDLGTGLDHPVVEREVGVDVVGGGRHGEHVVDGCVAVRVGRRRGQELEEIGLAVVEARLRVLGPQGHGRGDVHLAGDLEVEEPELGESGEVGAGDRHCAGRERLPVGDIHAIGRRDVTGVRGDRGRSRRHIGVHLTEVDGEVMVDQVRGAVELEPEGERDRWVRRAGPRARLERDGEGPQAPSVVGQVDHRVFGAVEVERRLRDVDGGLDGPVRQVDHHGVEEEVARGGEPGGDAGRVHRHVRELPEDLVGRRALAERLEGLRDLGGADGRRGEIGAEVRAEMGRRGGRQGPEGHGGGDGHLVVDRGEALGHADAVAEGVGNDRERRGQSALRLRGAEPGGDPARRSEEVVDRDVGELLETTGRPAVVRDGGGVGLGRRQRRPRDLEERAAVDREVGIARAEAGKGDISEHGRGRRDDRRVGGRLVEVEADRDVEVERGGDRGLDDADAPCERRRRTGGQVDGQRGRRCLSGVVELHGPGEADPEVDRRRRRQVEPVGDAAG